MRCMTLILSSSLVKLQLAAPLFVSTVYLCIAPSVSNVIKLSTVLLPQPLFYLLFPSMIFICRQCLHSICPNSVFSLSYYFQQFSFLLYSHQHFIISHSVSLFHLNHSSPQPHSKLSRYHSLFFLMVHVSLPYKTTHSNMYI